MRFSTLCGLRVCQGIALFLPTNYLVAKIGETEAQVRQRYGKAVFEDSDRESRTLAFHIDDLMVQVVFEQDISFSESFWKLPTADLSDSEITKLLESASLTGGWKLLSRTDLRQHWANGDQTVVAVYDISEKPHRLTVVKNKPRTDSDTSSDIVISPEEWLELLKKQAPPDLPRELVANALAAGPIAARASAALSKLSSHPEDRRAPKDLIRNNLQEWYASEMAKPYNTSRRLEFWQSIRQTNYSERAILMKSLRYAVTTSWQNLQTAAGILALPKVELEP